jgi:hypothetical protein
MNFRESPARTRRLDRIESIVPIAALAAFIVFLVIWSMLMIAIINDAYSTVLERESPPLITNQTELDLSEDTQDTDISINVEDMEEDALFENKTQVVSTEGADDIDIDGIPPAGVTVVITNETVFVTSVPVHLEMTDELAPSIVKALTEVANENNITLNFSEWMNE